MGVHLLLPGPPPGFRSCRHGPIPRNVGPLVHAGLQLWAHWTDDLAGHTQNKRIVGDDRPFGDQRSRPDHRATADPSLIQDRRPDPYQDTILHTAYVQLVCNPNVLIYGLYV